MFGSRLLESEVVIGVPWRIGLRFGSPSSTVSGIIVLYLPIRKELESHAYKH
jgi:hypothetical protein